MEPKSQSVPGSPKAVDAQPRAGLATPQEGNGEPGMVEATAVVHAALDVGSSRSSFEVGGSQPHRELQSYHVMSGALTGWNTTNLVQNALKEPLWTGGTDAASVETTKLPTGEGGPFHLTTFDFDVANYLPKAAEEAGPPPRISDGDAGWFDEVVSQQKLPDVFIMSGHNVISEGWHNNPETRFLYLPTLFDTLSRYPAAQQVFSHVKLAILGGCNTLTNLEPHGPDGRYLSPEEIAAELEKGGAQREAMVGTRDANNTLAFYKERLAREYGPGTEEYVYTLDPKKEDCKGPGKYDNCAITDLSRMLPESGLTDGSHRFNHPQMMKRLFPNAYLVLGFSSASPSEPARARILDEVLQLSRRDLATDRVNNVLGVLVDPGTPEPLREKIIETVRKHWTEVTYRLNRHRPSGSITPAKPHLDQNGIFNTVLSKDSPAYAPYEDRKLGK